MSSRGRRLLAGGYVSLVGVLIGGLALPVGTVSVVGNSTADALRSTRIGFPAAWLVTLSGPNAAGSRERSYLLLNPLVLPAVGAGVGLLPWAGRRRWARTVAATGLGGLLAATVWGVTAQPAWLYQLEPGLIARAARSATGSTVLGMCLGVAAGRWGFEPLAATTGPPS